MSAAGTEFKAGDVVTVRNTKALAHFPREAIVASVVPAGVPAAYALADLLGEPRPQMIAEPRRVVTYILVNEGDPTPYLARERDLKPSGKPPVEIGSITRQPKSEPEPARGQGMFLLPPAKHLCQVCAGKHPADYPHNAQTVFYQVKFKMDHGRDPTWADAYGHCSPDTQAAWRAALMDLGVDVDGGKINPPRKSARG